MSLGKQVLIELYKKLLLSRFFEERVSKLVTEGVVLGSVHLSLGEEATAVGTISALKKEDYILPTHRSHAQVLSKGADPAKVMAELAGRETGYSKGVSGSIHLFDSENNNLGSNGIIGAQFPIAAGVGVAIKHKKIDSVVACFFGDGASNQGWFYELLNLASLWNLPVILVCVNNLYGMGTPYSKTCVIGVKQKSKAFKIRSDVVNGNDVEEVYLKMRELVKYVRHKNKPALIECLTYRFSGHSLHDQRPYRPPAEISSWKLKDPLKIAKDKLIRKGISREELEILEKDTVTIIDKAEKFARGSKFAEFDNSMQL
jgi:pyruvate dehydrogenase E1 component alpha subunit